MPPFAAYGALLDPSRMADRCPHSPLRGTGWLTGWRLTFGGEDHGWDGALVTVAEDVGARVFVALYELAPEDRRDLGEWEGESIGLYRPVHLGIQASEGLVTAWTFVLDAYEGGLPSARTLGFLAESAEAAGAPQDYVADLRSRPCSGS